MKVQVGDIVMMDGLKTADYNTSIVKVVQKAPSNKVVVKTRSARLLPRVKVPVSVLVPTRPLDQIIKYTNVDLRLRWDDITREIINSSLDFTSPEHPKAVLAHGFFIGLDKRGPVADGSKVLSDWTGRVRFIHHTEWGGVESDFVDEQKMQMHKIAAVPLPYNRTFDWCGHNFNDDDDQVWVEYYVFVSGNEEEDPCQALLCKILTDQLVRGGSFIFAKLSIAASVC